MAKKRKELTVSDLFLICLKMIESGHRRTKVVVYKPTFRHPLEADGCNVLPVYDAELEFVTRLDENGFQKWLKDGSEAGRFQFVLTGSTTQHDLDEEARIEHEAVREKGRHRESRLKKRSTVLSNGGSS